MELASVPGLYPPLMFNHVCSQNRWRSAFSRNFRHTFAWWPIEISSFLHWFQKEARLLTGEYTGRRAGKAVSQYNNRRIGLIWDRSFVLHSITDAVAVWQSSLTAREITGEI